MQLPSPQSIGDSFWYTHTFPVLLTPSSGLMRQSAFHLGPAQLFANGARVQSIYV
jgi:hypothetical protein